MPVPSVILPSRSASLLIVATAVALVIPSTVFAAPAAKIGGSENAYTTLCDATKDVRDETKIGFAAKLSHEADTEAEDRPYSLDEITHLVQENQAPIDQVRKALRLPYTFPMTGVSIVTKNPYLAKFRTLARLFALDARLKAGTGNYAAAMDSSIDAITLGELTQTRTTYLGCLVGASCVMIGERAAWDIIPHLSGPESSAAAHRLEHIIATHPPFAETMANERIVARNSIPLLLNTTDPVEMVADTGYDFVGSDSDILKQGVVELRKAGPAAALADVDAAAAKSAHLNGGLWKTSDGNASPVGHYIITRFLFSVNIPKIRFSIIDAEAENRLLLTSLAVHAYDADHGRLPTDLKQLAPGYIKAVPADVFTAGDTLKYGIAGERAVIYSAGPDGIDDSGDPINNPGAKAQSERTLPAMDSTGDIVAGINI